MKKPAASLVVVLLALLLQLRVAYACEIAGHWPAEACSAHGLIVDSHGDSPSDRGGGDCDISIDLASRGGRTCTDLVAQLDLPDYQFLAVLPSPAPVIAPVPATEPIFAPDPVSPAGGSRIWLTTARLRL